MVNRCSEFLGLFKGAFDRGIVRGAICDAVDYLAKNGFLNNHNHTGNSVYLRKDDEFYTAVNKYIEKQADKKTGTCLLQMGNLRLNLLH